MHFGHEPHNRPKALLPTQPFRLTLCGFFKKRTVETQPVGTELTEVLGQCLDVSVTAEASESIPRAPRRKSQRPLHTFEFFVEVHADQS